ncbi:TPA: hypothetical protein ACOS77_001641 [Campylobacter jejuni]
MEEKNKYNQCLLLNGYEFLDFENTKNTTLKEWLKDENFLLFIKSWTFQFTLRAKLFTIQKSNKFQFVGTKKKVQKCIDKISGQGERE